LIGLVKARRNRDNVRRVTCHHSGGGARRGRSARRGAPGRLSQGEFKNPEEARFMAFSLEQFYHNNRRALIWIILWG